MSTHGGSSSDYMTTERENDAAIKLRKRIRMLEQQIAWADAVLDTQAGESTEDAAKRLVGRVAEMEAELTAKRKEAANG